MNLLAFFCLFLFSPEAISKNKLNEMRISYNSQEVKIRIVFDANKKINYKLDKTSKKNTIKASFLNIDTTKNLKVQNLVKNILKN